MLLGKEFLILGNKNERNDRMYLLLGKVILLADASFEDKRTYRV